MHSCEIIWGLKTIWWWYYIFEMKSYYMTFILADQLTLSQPGARRGRLCPPQYYWHPRIFRPSYGPELLTYLWGKNLISISSLKYIYHWHMYMYLGKFLDYNPVTYIIKIRTYLQMWSKYFWYMSIVCFNDVIQI